MSVLLGTSLPEIHSDDHLPSVGGEARQASTWSPATEDRFTHGGDPLLDAQGADSTLGGNLGGKTIGAFGSFALTVNNITGPGMLHLAAVFQKAGLIVPLVVFALICISSTGAAQLLCDAIARLPGNSKLEVRYEYSDAFRHYLGPCWASFSQVLFFFGIFTQTVASIIGTAQSMDGLIVLMFEKAWAVQVSGPHDSPWFLTWTQKEYCSPKDVEDMSQCIPFSSFGDAPDIGIIVTAGYVVTAVAMAPLGFYNLDDNIKFQIVSFWVLLILSMEFCADMVYHNGIHFDHISMFGNDYTPVLGTIMFNFAYCPTIPSWLNEKKAEVNAGKVLWTSAATATVLYLVTGILTAVSFTKASDNILQILSAGETWLLTKICAFTFGLGVVGLGIPVFCIVMRYNLLVAGKCSNFTSTMLGVIMPWATSWLLYQGKASEIFISISGVILISAVGFLAPLMVALAAAGVTTVGAGGVMGWFRRICADANVDESCCSALPASKLRHQRRYVGVLLAFLVPAVLVGMTLTLINPDDS